MKKYSEYDFNTAQIVCKCGETSIWFKLMYPWNYDAISDWDLNKDLCPKCKLKNDNKDLDNNDSDTIKYLNAICFIAVHSKRFEQLLDKNIQTLELNEQNELNELFVLLNSKIVELKNDNLLLTNEELEITQQQILETKDLFQYYHEEINKNI